MRAFGVDAGGSRTRVLVDDLDPGGRTRYVTGSVNRASNARADTARAEADVLDLVGRREVAGGWFASSTVGTVPAPGETARLADLLERHGVGGTVWISNDKTALLFGDLLGGVGCVAVVGTGTGYVGRNAAGQVHEVGGVEYLASDQGSAFDLGQRALRAAAAAADRSGPATMLLELVAERLRGELRDRLRSLATTACPKPVVAGFAELATAAWRAGDPVAARLVADSLEAVLVGVRTVHRQTPLPTGATTVLAGGVVTGCPEYTRALTELLTARLATRVEVCADPVGQVLAAAHRFLAGAGADAGPLVRTVTPSTAAVLTAPAPTAATATGNRPPAAAGRAVPR